MRAVQADSSAADAASKNDWEVRVAELEDDRAMLAKRLHVGQQRIIELQKQVDALTT